MAAADPEMLQRLETRGGTGMVLASFWRFFPKVNSSEIDILWVSKHQQWEIIGYS